MDQPSQDTLRKPPAKVVSITGEHRDDVITQQDFKEICDLQAAVWTAERAAHEAVLLIETRLKLGASIEPGPLDFDHSLRMVRSKRAG